jgi:glycine/D-amino acid oxidase-like deaminating enzyme
MKSSLNSVAKPVDLAVVGGGLAGCAMVWQAIRQGLTVVMIDDGNRASSSRVAAGLVTPITGGRLAMTWRYTEYYRAAEDLYRYVERETGSTFWTMAPALRLFSSSEERDLFESRWSASSQLGLDSSIQTQQLSSDELAQYAAPFGGFLMSPAARLDTVVYLQATQRILEQHGSFYSCSLDLDRDLIASPPCPAGLSFEFPTLGVRARQVCLAQGVAALSNRWFALLPLHPARGDILRVASGPRAIDHIVHRDAWIVPLGDHQHLLGATYSRDWQSCELDSTLAIASREDLLGRWRAFFQEPVPGVKVLEHRAAVRPASYDRHPLIGTHPEYPNLGCLNGLGSKGSLLAPRLAEVLLDTLDRSTPIDPALRYDRRRG